MDRMLGRATESGRADDTPEAIRVRLEKQKPPAELLEHYRKAGKLKDVDGLPEIPFVTEAIMRALGVDAHGGEIGCRCPSSSSRTTRSRSCARRGSVVAQTLRRLVEELRPGLVVKDLDKVVRREFEKHKVVPTFLGYHGYPATVCVSVNEEIVHGIPGKRVIQDGDVVSLDLGCTYKGFVADSALTVIVGKAKPGTQELVDVTRESLQAGIKHARAGNRLGEISHAIQTYIESHGFGVVREYVGHGVGPGDARGAAGAELRPGGPRPGAEEGHGAGAGADGDRRRLADAAAGGPLDRRDG